QDPLQQADQFHRADGQSKSNRLFKSPVLQRGRQRAGSRRPSVLIRPHSPAQGRTTPHSSGRTVRGGNLLSTGRAVLRSHPQFGGAWVAVFYFREQLWNPNRLCRRGNGCNRRRPRDRKSSESSARRAVAQDPPGHLFDKRKSHALCARPVSIGSAHLVSPKISVKLRCLLAAALIARRPPAISLPRLSWSDNFPYSRPSSKWFFLRPRKLS